jgi:2-desacetyl-2-hydroxyethyl bacteriochlorophyllide A dehydrogenase
MNNNAITTMPLVRIHAVGQVALDHVERPQAGPDDVVVQVALCGICGSDLGYIATGGFGPDAPMPLGHELSGTIVDAGANVVHVQVGDRVVVNPEGNNNGIGNYGPEGGFAPLLLVRGVAIDNQSVIKLPEVLTERQGALVEPLSVAMHATHQGQAKAEDKAVIFGAGTIGLGILLVLRYYGLNNIVIVDLSEHRLAIAEKMGAVTFKSDSGDLASFLSKQHGTSELLGTTVPDSDLYFEATGVGAVFEQAVSVGKRGARLVVVGVHKKPVQLDLVNALIRELSITFSLAYPDEFPKVIAMLASGKVDADALISHQFSLSDFQQALSTAQDASQAIKVLVDCQQ